MDWIYDVAEVVLADDALVEQLARVLGRRCSCVLITARQ
jgi:hypothetical protein